MCNQLSSNRSGQDDTEYYSNTDEKKKEKENSHVISIGKNSSKENDKWRFYVINKK